MFYDKFGQAAVSFSYRWKELEPYMVKEVEEEATATTPKKRITYICYTDDAIRAIKRITEVDNMTTIEIGFGAWDECAGLTYQPINKEINA